MIKTAELKGKPLDWALAKALEYEPQVKFDHVFVPALKRGWPISGVVPFDHTDPATCLSSQQQHKMDVTWGTSGNPFVQMSGGLGGHWYGGKTLPEAVARCVIAMRLGDEVEVPSELVGEQA